MKKAIVIIVLYAVLFPSCSVQAANIISWKDADQFYGQYKTVEGEIVFTKCTPKVCFLNFHPNWEVYFTAVIFAPDRHKFPDNPDKYYLNKRVRVTGKIKKHKGKPEIILKSPDQIMIVK